MANFSQEIELPEDVRAVRLALWAAPQEAGVTIKAVPPEEMKRGFVQMTSIGGYMAMFSCLRPAVDPVEATEAELWVSHESMPLRDGFSLLWLSCHGGRWELRIRQSPTLYQWNDLYYVLTGDGILVQRSPTEVRPEEALVIAAHVGRFLAERAGA